jgi:rare lipoprotein A
MGHVLRASLIGLAFVGLSCAHEAERPFVAPTPGLREEPRPAGNYDFTRPSVATPSPDAKPDEVGLATWYGRAFAGRRTANGERFDPTAMTAAHRKLPFGTWVEVRRPDTGRSIRVRITDRGPWGDSRKVIDVSKAAADALGFAAEGTVKVELRVVRGAE